MWKLIKRCKKIKYSALFGWLLCALSLPVGAATCENTPSSQSTPRLVRYAINDAEGLYYQQNEYFFAVLQLALQKSQSGFAIKCVAVPTLPQGRSLSLIQDGYYDIHWMGTSIEREGQLKPIRIPLYKGLIGLRLAFVSDQQPDLLANVDSLAKLSKLVAGQGRDWIDSKVFHHHQLKMIETSDTMALFELLKIGRIEYFPRSVVEIWYEQQLMHNEGVAVDQHIALYYPTAVYFFVRNDDEQLHLVVSKGLNAAIDDGSFDALFYQHYGDFISRANLAKRRIFRMDNPYMSAQTPLDVARLWFDFSSAASQQHR